MRTIKNLTIVSLALLCSIVFASANPIINDNKVTEDVVVSEENPADNSKTYVTKSYNSHDRGWRWKNGRYAGFNLNYNGLVQNLSNLRLPSEADFMDQTPSSIGVDINFCDFVIASNGITSLVTGLGLESNNFRFENNISLTKDQAGFIVADYSYEDRGIKLSKSKLTTTYLNIPLLVQFNLGRKPWKDNQMWISGGVVGGMLIQGYTKVKAKEFGKHKEFNNLNLRSFHWGYQVSAGYGAYALTVKYYPHSIFRDGKGPNVQQVSIGLGVLFNYD